MKVLISLFVFLMVLLSSYTMVCQAHNGKTAYAIPLSGISIDGKLDDWPEDIIVYPIEWVSPNFYKQTPPDGPEDFTASFRVGYDPTENVLYVAVVVKDDDLVTHPKKPKIQNQDVCGIYVDADHSGGEGEIQGQQLYVMVPGTGKWTSGQDGNPSLNLGDTKASGMKGTFSHSEQTLIYEWAIPLFDSFPDKRSQIQPGKTIGLDFLIADADGQENANFVVWTPEAGKSRTSDLFGHLVFLKGYEDLGNITGTVTTGKGKLPNAGIIIEAYRNDHMMTRIKTDSMGRYELKLHPGDYTLKVIRGQGLKPSGELALTVRAGELSKSDFTVIPVELPLTLLKSMALYKSLKAYRDTSTFETHIVQSGMEDKQISSQLLFAFERPNRILNKNIIDSTISGDIELFSNGEKMVYYMGMWKQYKEEDAPEVLTSDKLRMIQSILARNIILRDDPLKDLMKSIEEVKEVGSEKLNGKSTSIFELVLSASSLGISMAPGQAGEDIFFPVRLWLGSEDKLIRKIAYELDMERLLESLPGDMRESMESVYKGMTVNFTETHTGVELNPAFSEADFTFIPPEGAELVEQFKPTGSSRFEASKITGKPAPDFILKDIDGKKAKLADFEGKVVLIDFWATWCAPCVEAMPHIQALFELYKEDDVIVLGINSWERDKDRVEPFLKEQKITYRILLDSKNEVIKKYGVSGIPTFFIIDKKGVIRHVYLGMPENPQTIQQKVEELLAE